jgi:hypothetical protein
MLVAWDRYIAPELERDSYPPSAEQLNLLQDR